MKSAIAVILGALLLGPVAITPAQAQLQGESRRNVPDWIERAREAGEREQRQEQRRERGVEERAPGRVIERGERRERGGERFDERGFRGPRGGFGERDVIVREREVGPRFGSRTVCRDRIVRRYDPRRDVVVERPVRVCREVE